MALQDVLPRRYLIFIFIFSSILLSSFVYVLYRQSRTIENSYAWVQHSYEVLRLTRHVLTSAQEMEIGYRGYALTRSRELYEPYRLAAETIDAEVEGLKRYVGDNPEQTQNTRLLEASVVNFKQVLADAMKQPEGNIGQYLRASKDAKEVLRGITNTIITEENNLLKQRSLIAQERQERYQMTMLLGCGLAIGGLVVANGIILGQMNRNKRSESALRETQERFLTVMNSVQHGIFDYNVQEGTIHYSPSFKKMLGYEDHEMEDTLDEFNRRLHLDDREKTWEVAHKFFRHEIPEYINYFRLRHKDGTYRWIMARAIGIWNSDGTIQRLLGTHTDITDQKRAEERLRSMNQDLESFAYIASHDLRAPLVNLKGFAGELQMSLDEITPVVDDLESSIYPEARQKLHHAMHEDMPEAIRFIRSSVEKMDLLTNAILDLSRIGRRELKPEPVEPKVLVERCLNSLAYEISSRRIKVEVGELPSLATDMVALEQIFGNLLDNAVKYLDPSRPGQITINGRKMEGEVRFSVRDNGRGIAHEDYGKVFDIFRRAGNSADVRGAGMGMAYVQATLRRLGGRIWFESVLHQGTVFHFVLPEVMTGNVKN